MALNARKPLSRRDLLGVAGVIVMLAISSAFSIPTFAHITTCPNCNMDVVQDTATQDNEVAIRYGRKRIEYRCVSCALTQAKSDEFTGDLNVLAPSEIKGKPVLISRKDGKWSVLPQTAVFVGLDIGHENCYIANRAFSNKAAFAAYVKSNHALLAGAKPLTLAQMLLIAK